MKKGQLILIGLAIALVVVLLQLPTAVVKNETDVTMDSHSTGVSDLDASAIQSLRVQLALEENENLTNFADSLARYYLKYGYMDSAVSVARKYLIKENSSLETLHNAGAIFNSALERSQTNKEATERNELSQQVYQRIIDHDSEDLLAKTRLAMTKVSSDNPMVGITMLREVLEADPEFREAILNLGLLSIRSGQHERAVARFEKLLEMDSLDYEAMLYQGIALESIDVEKSRKLFEQIAQSTDADPALVVTAQQYLEN
jgi:tetratricopeptide (TPR) repeat protein